MGEGGVRAVVLAAGLGTRLRPLTEFEPKPLLPVGGRPLIAHTLAQLESAGCEAVALNLHHLGDRIRGRMGSEFGKMPLTYSDEPVLMGTLGALAPLRSFWKDAEVLVVINGDTLCRFPVKRLIRKHLKLGARATLLLTSRARVEEYGGGVGVDAEGRLISFRPGRAFGEVRKRRVFAGAHALSPQLIDDMPSRPLNFVPDLYVPMLEDGRTIQTVETRTRWFESGTPELYLRSVRGFTRGRWRPRLLQRSWIGAGAAVSDEAKVSKAVVEADVVVEKGASVSRSLLLPGARVTEGCVVRDAIIGFGVALPPDTSVVRHMVTPERANVSPRATDSIVGGLVYSPLRPPSGAAPEPPSSPAAG